MDHKFIKICCKSSLSASPRLQSSVADPYHFETDPDPDPGCEKIRYGSGSGSRVKFDTDPDPGQNNTDPGKSLQRDEKRS